MRRIESFNLKVFLWSPNQFSFLVILGDQQLYVFLIYLLFK